MSTQQLLRTPDHVTPKQETESMPHKGGSKTTQSVRPRRTMLYVSGANVRHLQKACSLPADSLIFDLHEAVTDETKEQARDAIGATLRAGSFRGHEIVVRINPLQSRWFDADVAWLADQCVDAVLLTHVESVSQLQEAMSRIDQVTGRELPIMVMIETPMAVLRSEEIAANERVVCLVLETNGLESSLRLFSSSDRIGLQGSLALVVLAARAHGCGVVDGAHLNLGEARSCEFSCRQGREMGFDGKTVVHPVQLTYTNEAYTPKPKDVNRARELVETMAAANARGEAVAMVDGRMISYEQVKRARLTLDLFESIKARDLSFTA